MEEEMPGLEIFGVITQHPWVSLFVFMLVGAGVLLALSGGALVQSLAGLLRVFLTIFTTPFEFLRDSLSIIRTARETEKDYYRTRIFMLYRYSRLQYFALLFFALLVLCAGITSSLLSLYPQAEIAQRKALSEQITQVKTEIDTTRKEVSDASRPERRQELEKARNDSKKKLDQQRAANAGFVERFGYSGPVVTDLLKADSVTRVQELQGGLNDYMASCPDGYDWNGFNQTMCAEFKAGVQELARRRSTEITLTQAAEEAEKAFASADMAGEIATARLKSLEGSLVQLQKDRAAISLFDPKLIGAKLRIAGAILLGAALLVVVIVWLGAILIDILNWIILMMRVTEKHAVTRLPNAAQEYEPPPSPQPASGEPAGTTADTAAPG
jgi:hypothetical protein